MTTEEAIDYLERCADGLDPNFDNAVSLAVAALHAQQDAEKNEPLTLGELRKMTKCLDEFCYVIGKNRTCYFCYYRI